MFSRFMIYIRINVIRIIYSDKLNQTPRRIIVVVGEYNILSSLLMNTIGINENKNIYIYIYVREAYGKWGVQGPRDDARGIRQNLATPPCLAVLPPFRGANLANNRTVLAQQPWISRLAFPSLVNCDLSILPIDDEYQSEQSYSRVKTWRQTGTYTWRERQSGGGGGRLWRMTAAPTLCVPARCRLCLEVEEWSTNTAVLAHFA